MMKYMKKWQTQQKAVIILLLFYIPFHLWLTPGYWDDAVFAGVLEKYQFNLVQYTMDRYLTWSSRISIELLIPFLTSAPNFVWKTFNLLMIMLLYFDLRWTLKAVVRIESEKVDIWLALLLCAYPFSTMAQTGWIATTMNYLWVVALGWYVINRLLNTVLQRDRVSKKDFLFVGLAAFYSTAFESMAAILLLITMGIIVYSYKKKYKISGLVWICMGITIFMLVYIFMCPGNQLRPLKDAELWMPDYYRLTFLDKIRVGIGSAFMHFVSIPSPIFFVLNLSLLMLGIRRECCAVTGKRRSAWGLLTAAIPMILDVVWTCYFLLSYLRGERTVTYHVPSAIPAGQAEIIEQFFLVLSVIAWFGSVIYIMFQNLHIQRSVCITCILFLACIPEIAVGITPTVYASILRTTIYLYMAMIIMIVGVCYELKMDTQRKLQFIYSFCFGCGIFLNACQIARHILLYG